MSKQVMQQALDALEESIDIVQAEHANAVSMYSNYPSRQARIDALKLEAEKHNAAIEALRAAIAAPEPEPVGHLYTIAGVQHCTIEKVLEDGPLYAAQPSTAPQQPFGWYDPSEDKFSRDREAHKRGATLWAVYRDAGVTDQDMAANAKRYLWLRDCGNPHDLLVVKNDGAPLYDSALDTAVDAAIAAQGGGS